MQLTHFCHVQEFAESCNHDRNDHGHVVIGHENEHHDALLDRVFSKVIQVVHGVSEVILYR
jgi:hypothetical protein